MMPFGVNFPFAPVKTYFLQREKFTFSFYEAGAQKLQFPCGSGLVSKTPKSLTERT